MKQFSTILETNEKWLVNHLRSVAGGHGFTQHADTLNKAWPRSVKAVNQALVRGVETFGITPFQLDPGDTYTDDPISRFAIEQARHHRALDVTLFEFMAMLKDYRRAYLDLFTEKADGEMRNTYLNCVNHFFDRMEIAQCADWTNQSEQEQVQRLKETNAAMAEERNRFLSLFESLHNPVFLLSNDLVIQTMNRSAADLLCIDGPGSMSPFVCPPSAEIAEEAWKPVPLREVAPWLADALNDVCPLKPDANYQFDVTADLKTGTRHFTTSVSRLEDFSDTHTGITMILDDVTLHVEMGKQLASERNRAAHYIDVVGSIVLALDASGGITLINEAGCRVLGYDKSELLGRNWIDIIVPAEQRDEVRDYLFYIISDDLELDDLHTNYVTTKNGEHRLIEWNNRILRNEGGLPIGIIASGMDITEQRVLEEAMAEKELWLRNTFVALGEAVFILSPDRQVIDVNPAAEIMFEMTNEELIASQVEELHVDHAHYIEFGMLAQEASEVGGTANFEFEMRRKSGQTFPTDHSISLIHGDDGTPLGFVSVIRDISQRKAAELELKQSEEKFRRIFESIEEGYVVADMEGIIQMVNPATCRQLGYEEEELLGTPLGRLYADEEDRSLLRMAIAEHGAVRGFQLRASHRDGSVIFVEANAHMLVDEDGQPVGMEGTFRDITARIEAEKILREREKQYRAFFENNHAIMLLEDPQTGMIEDANPAAAAFYGYTVEQMRSMNSKDISALTEEEIYKEMFAARKENRVYFILKHRQASGDIRDVEVYSGPILVQGRQLLYSVIHDVTERIQLQREMRRMATTDALTGVDNRHQFFHAATQELRRSLRYKTPLSVLMLDIDYFKSINDTHGHQAGDVVLKGLAAMAKTTLRDSDIFGRLGGEEFAAILPETPLDSALYVAERLREELGKLVIETEDKEITFTVSIGVSLVTESDTIIEDALNRADEALYKAKRTGRNRVEKL